MKLHELHINDFKFFPEVDPNSPLLKIKGNHVLIYGENGSGKSTIFWALYTLLECSLKDDDDQVRKYFKKTGKDSLVNIHAIGRNNSHIKAVLKDDNGTKKVYKVSRKKRDLRIRGNSDVQESNMASDFINYRVLFQLHNLKHSKDNDLFHWFLEEVLPYVKRGSNPCLDEYNKLIQGPGKYRNIHGDDVYPVPSLRTHTNPGEKAHYSDYLTFKRRVKTWSDWLKSFLETIMNIANNTINTDFGYDLKLKFDYTRFDFSISENDFNPKPPEIRIKIIEYEGIQNPKINKPHTFLNEAKWSAIGMSLRLAILDTKLFAADLKCLVIDDMLLSLDMGNRDVVLDILLNRYTSDYQLIMMTHDRSFYEIIKRRIDLRRESNNWLITEMYSDELSTKPKPYFKPLKPSLHIASDYFKQHDYPACGIYLRKETEKILSELLPSKFRKVPDRDDPNKLVDAALNDLILGLRPFCKAENVNYSKYEKIKIYKDAILNPLAHNDVDVPFFRKELEELMNTIELLTHFKRSRSFHKSNKNTNFILRKPDGSYYSVRMKVKEEIKLIEEKDENLRISIFSKCKVSSVDNNGTITTQEENFDNLREVYEEMCSRFSLALIQGDISNVFDYDGQDFTTKLNQMNV
ncbi:AAA family ATPase [Fulvivirgaceae bacterium BMA10]|uniref:AAA family ATPase n=1 Tax=Splendidivirga corallicola TaxID=3051826 RepID=A0ABT8KQ23_9BACT|nr:AAA family ATPase [Fulvivirgaceae bacterium BMA10]